MESGFWIFLADLDVGVKEEEHAREGGEGEVSEGVVTVRPR